MAAKVLTLPLPLLTADQNLLKNSCLPQCSPSHQISFLSFHHDYHHLLHVCFRCAHLKNTPPQCLKNYIKIQNTYDGEPFDFIFNQLNVFSGIVDRTFFFDYIYNNVLFSRNRECDKKGVHSVTERRKTKNEAAISFWWYCKA